MTLTASPARAADLTHCENFPKGPDFQALYLCTAVDTFPHWAEGWGSLNVGGGFGLYPTNCTLTAWVELKGATGGSWTTKPTQFNCQIAFQDRGRTWSGEHSGSGTGATQALGHACVDLYFDGSSHSGWQSCTAAGWQGIPQ